MTSKKLKRRKSKSRKVLYVIEVKPYQSKI